MYNWFFIFNSNDFAALNLVSRTYTVILAGIGQVDVLVTQGELLSMLYDGVFLSLNMNGDNPFEFDSHAAYIDDNNNVWLGLPIED